MSDRTTAGEPSTPRVGSEMRKATLGALPVSPSSMGRLET